MSDNRDCVSLSSLSVEESLKEEPMGLKVQVLIPRCRMAEWSIEMNINLQSNGCTYVNTPTMSFYLCGILFIIGSIILLDYIITRYKMN